MSDQDGMHALVSAIDALSDDPEPPGSFHRGRYHRLRLGAYRVIYFSEAGDLVIYRVDKAESC
jgi:mRNA-degrading endonuclease RelE of RelBE toxin-antitoxin system